MAWAYPRRVEGCLAVASRPVAEVAADERRPAAFADPVAVASSQVDAAVGVEQWADDSLVVDSSVADSSEVDSSGADSWDESYSIDSGCDRTDDCGSCRSSSCRG